MQLDKDNLEMANYSKKASWLLSALIFIFLTVFTYGCYENNSIYPATYYPSYPSGGGVYVSNAAQNYSFENNYGFSGYLNQGTYLNIPPNAFVDNNGLTVSGHINLIVKEIYKKSDMFYFGVNTLADSNLIESGGMLYLSATRDNISLNLKTGIHISASFPVKGTRIAMQFFNGATTNGITNWQRSKDTANNYVSIAKDSTRHGSNYFYNITSNGLQWINADHFLNLSPLTTVRVSISRSVAYESITCALDFGNNSLAILSADTGINNFMITNMPIGQKVTLVVLAKSKNNYYSAFLPLTISTNLKQSVVLQPVSNQNFYEKLKTFD